MEDSDLAKIQGLLPDTICQHLSQCGIALSEGNYFASALWGAVFLEAFLVAILDALDVSPGGQDDLNGRIQRLQQYSRNPPPDRPHIPDGIVKSCNEIRHVRNRLVHHTGIENKSIEQDAKHIHTRIETILEWCLGWCEGHGMTLRENDAEKSVGLPPVRARMFLSRNSPDNERQKYFLTTFKRRLREMGIDPVELVSSKYDKKDPLAKTKKTIGSCQALIAVGFERTHAYFWRDREGTLAQEENTHRKYASGWVHLEAGMASALGLDVFVLCEKDIHSDGIFDRDWNTYTVIDLEALDVDAPDIKPFFDRIAEWMEEQDQTKARTG